MPRPCLVNHAIPDMACPICKRLADPSPAWDYLRRDCGPDIVMPPARDAKIGDGRGTPPPLRRREVDPVMMAPPCIYRGAPTGEMTTCGTCRGGTQLKTFACSKFGSCTIDRQSNWGHIRMCKDCPDREAPESSHPLLPAPVAPKPPPTRSVLVPQPPPLTGIAPKHDRAVVTVAVGTEAESLLAITGPYMRAYAARLNADFVVLDWPGHPDWPMSAKFAIPTTLSLYERIAYVDADVLLRPGCLSLFDACHPDEMGVVDELPWHRAQPKFGREAGYLKFRRDMGFKDVPHLPWMANMGIFVAPASHKHLLLPPVRPITTTHCSEQDHSNAMLLDSGLPLRLMDRRLNHQNWTDWGFKAAPPEAVLHFSGAGAERAKRLVSIRQWAANHPLPG